LATIKERTMFQNNDGARTKVLAELMHHMIGLHGAASKHSNPEMHTSNATLPHADGTPKHDPKGKIEGVSLVSAPSIGESDRPVDMNEHGGEGDHPVDHDLNDLFGRKKPGHAEYF
jgi:hypothetical protein